MSLSFCLWETRRQAIEAAGAAAHQSAAEISVRMYESYVLDRYWLQKVVSERDCTTSWSLQDHEWSRRDGYATIQGTQL